MKQVVIIGNGVAGITAARHIRKGSDCKLTVVSSETPYFFSRTALMYVYMGQLTFEHTKPYEDWFWKKNKIDLVFDHAESVDITNRTLTLRSGQILDFDNLIIATGSLSNTLGIPGEQLNGVQTLYSYQDLQAMEAATSNAKQAVVVGGGLIGVELAEMLHSRKINTTVIVRESAFWNNVLPMPEARMISRHITSHGIHILHEDELTEIVPDSVGRVKAIRTKNGVEIPCAFVGIAVGVRPNVALLANSSVKVNRGIIVDEYLETNIPGIYAIGDCAERRSEIPGRKNIEQVWYTARMMGETVARTICGDKTAYRPGPWFNSAKFFEIEFQTYGIVANEPAQDEDDFYWEHSSGAKAIHLVWKKKTKEFGGINAFGIRLRHECFDRWLREKRSVDYVVQRLREGNFDPEFSRRHDLDIVRSFTQQQTTISQD